MPFPSGWTFGEFACAYRCIGPFCRHDIPLCATDFPYCPVTPESRAQRRAPGFQRSIRIPMRSARAVSAGPIIAAPKSSFVGGRPGQQTSRTGFPSVCDCTPASPSSYSRRLATSTIRASTLRPVRGRPAILTGTRLLRWPRQLLTLSTSSRSASRLTSFCRHQPPMTVGVLTSVAPSLPYRPGARRLASCTTRHGSVLCRSHHRRGDNHECACLS